MSGIQLRASGDRAVLVDEDDDGERVTEPDRLPLGTELTDALHEWAKVAAAVGRAEPGAAAGSVVSRRGLQLAGRVAQSLGVSVVYVDPLSGTESTVEPVLRPKRPPRPPRPVEPVPWLTGLTVTAASLALTVVTVVTLAATLAETYSLLAVASNLVVTAGLLPSLWLIKRQPIWRWVAYGVAIGLGLAWVALPFVIF
ncbi:DUF2537 domain-containing protein [Actinophytocola oryzae]|uniref:Uncharacterized protein DUF2537 n=1 Tax=Actinophytocola oryzae TaxID=502181 RepID=A0A4R7V029_9PSEU|nr:DUF2537 domain-containing protein [Actinophytocola oryzae]TDV41817.1 uncharacterized protein DUF2537 [Actinophytocola oryzae]